MWTAGHFLQPEELMAFADGELPAESAAEVKAHIDGCADCRAIIGDLRWVSLRVAEWRVEDAPGSGGGALPVRIAERLDRPRRHRVRELFHAYRWFAYAGAALVAFFLADGIIVQRPAQSLRLQQFAALEQAPAPDRSERMIVRTTTLSLTTRDFGNSRAEMERAAGRYAGYIASIDIASPENAGRSLNATIRVPSSRLDGLLSDLRKLGHVVQESQSGNDVTKDYVDLDARLRNARNTEQRLSVVQRERTGKLSDVLDVEKEISRVRGEIEQMDAERRSLLNRADFATVHLIVNEDFKAQLDVMPRSIGGRLRNAAVEGYRSVADSVINTGEFLLAFGPAIVFWSLLLFWPMRTLWRRVIPYIRK